MRTREYWWSVTWRSSTVVNAHVTTVQLHKEAVQYGAFYLGFLEVPRTILPIVRGFPHFFPHGSTVFFFQGHVAVTNAQCYSMISIVRTAVLQPSRTRSAALLFSSLFLVSCIVATKWLQKFRCCIHAVDSYVFLYSFRVPLFHLFSTTWFNLLTRLNNPIYNTKTKRRQHSQDRWQKSGDCFVPSRRASSRSNL